MAMSPEQMAKLHSEVGQGREVAALTSNETFKKVLNDSLHGIQNAWLREKDAEQREYLWQQGAGLQAFADNLQSIVNTGKMAEHQIAVEREFEKQNVQGRPQ
jgi:hypothetical protein